MDELTAADANKDPQPKIDCDLVLPVPTLPPASYLANYRMSDMRRSNDFLIRLCESDDFDEKVTCLKLALAVFPFSVQALCAWAEAYRNDFAPPQLDKAEQTYKLAITSARIQRSYKWMGHSDAIWGLANTQKERGKFKEAMKTYQSLESSEFKDLVRMPLFCVYLQLGKYEQAEAVEKKRKKESHYDMREAYFRFGLILLDFLKFKVGACSEKKVRSTVAQAIECNIFVLPMLLGDLPVKEERQIRYERPEDISHASKVAREMIHPFQRASGLLDWIRTQQSLRGDKPNDDGSTLFQLLQRGRILVNTKTENLMQLSTRIDLIMDSPYNYDLPAGMKEHNLADIVAFDHRKVEFLSLSYEDVVSVPFWKILQKSKAFGRLHGFDLCEYCTSEALYMCSACKVITYCSEDCQRKHWKGVGMKSDDGPRHKILCRKLQKP
jgi:hypothetical protein